MSSRFEYVADGSQDAAAMAAINEHQRRAHQVAAMASAANQSWVPPPKPPPVFGYDGSEDAWIISQMETQRRRSFVAATAGGTPAVPYVDEELPAPAADELPVLVSRAVIIPYQKTSEGYLIRAVSLPLLKIIEMILKDPSHMYKIDPRKWEEIIAAAYDQSGQFDEVTLTPRSGDDGRDVIAVRNGFGSVRLLESVKRYSPKQHVEASEVRDLLGALGSDHRASKGVLSTTWEFAPKVKTNPQFTQYMPHRLELVDIKDLMERFKQYTDP